VVFFAIGIEEALPRGGQLVQIESPEVFGGQLKHLVQLNLLLGFLVE
jgi:hypothetical protein